MRQSNNRAMPEGMARFLRIAREARFNFLRIAWEARFNFLRIAREARFDFLRIAREAWFSSFRIAQEARFNNSASPRGGSSARAARQRKAGSCWSALFLNMCGRALSCSRERRTTGAMKNDPSPDRNRLRRQEDLERNRQSR